uniref:Retinol dehydrogenase 14 n=1 Tax=Timema tahoe TaxID=61484 RepID=A0A7R9INE1_9NEOP|nr:unnamed protein product [Timema tahoe]
MFTLVEEMFPSSDLLKKSSPSRIVIVASELYRLARLDLNNLNPVQSFPAYLYYVSKYANIVFSLELSRRLENTGVTVNCLHPGMIDSGIWRNVPYLLKPVMKLIIKGFFKNPEEGAQTSIHLAVSEEVNNVTGKYFLDCKVSVHPHHPTHFIFTRLHTLGKNVDLNSIFSQHPLLSTSPPPAIFEYSLKEAVKDPAKGKKLWEKSEELVKLQTTDPHI